MIKIKHIYEPPDPRDGLRILVDRLWPRGLSKGRARVDLWMKEIAPSDELRHWFAHDPDKWQEFRVRYRRELSNKDPLLEEIRTSASKGVVTLLYAARDEEYNNAVVLKEFLEE